MVEIQTQSNAPKCEENAKPSWVGGIVTGIAFGGLVGEATHLAIQMSIIEWLMGLEQTVYKWTLLIVCVIVPMSFLLVAYAKEKGRLARYSGIIGGGWMGMLIGFVFASDFCSQPWGLFLATIGFSVISTGVVIDALLKKRPKS